MLGKLAALAHSKVALSLLGVVLVGGSGGAVAVAATTGHLSTLGVDLNPKTTSTTTLHADSSNDSNDSHAHTIGVEGLLTACNTSAHTITVKDKNGKSWTVVVNTSTKLNGDVNTGAQGASNETGEKGNGGASTGSSSGNDHHTGASGDNSAHAGSAGGASSDTHAGGSSGATADNGKSHDAEPGNHVVTLAQVCAAANLNVSDVQVQATQSGSQYVAWKVTLQGPGNETQGTEGSDSSSTSDSKGASSVVPTTTATH